MKNRLGFCRKVGRMVALVRTESRKRPSSLVYWLPISSRIYFNPRDGHPPFYGFIRAAGALCQRNNRTGSEQAAMIERQDFETQIFLDWLKNFNAVFNSLIFIIQFNPSFAFKRFCWRSNKFILSTAIKIDLSGMKNLVFWNSELFVRTYNNYQTDSSCLFFIQKEHSLICKVGTKPGIL